MTVVYLVVAWLAGILLTKAEEVGRCILPWVWFLGQVGLPISPTGWIRGFYFRPLLCYTVAGETIYVH